MFTKRSEGKLNNFDAVGIIIGICTK